MKRILLSLSVLFAAILVGCIENDLPMPVIEPRITSMQVDGATEVFIDSEKRNVAITLNEQTDISKVNITAVEFDNEQTKTSMEIVGSHDLSQKLSFTKYRNFAIQAYMVLLKNYLTTHSLLKQVY